MRLQDGAATLTALATVTLAAAGSDVSGFTFKAVSPEQQKSELDDSARSDPSSVRYVPGISIPDDVARPILASSSVTVSASTSGAATSCASPAIYYEWRDVSDDQRRAFVDALHCLTTKPARSGLSSTHSRWDDLDAIHHGLIDEVHGTGAFLHWHRYFLWMLKQELRNACGYKGPMLWWDETKDAGHFADAPMLNGDYLGDLDAGDDVPQNVTNGIFANLPLHIGPGPTNTDRTLNRLRSESDSAHITTEVIKTCWSWTDFVNMTNCVEGGPHASGHNAIGGIMGDVYSSAGDPIFFLHHAFIDHVFWGWQNIDPPARSNAVGGNANVTCMQDCEQVTLDYLLTSYNFTDSHPIKDFADTKGDFLCYTYNY